MEKMQSMRVAGEPIPDDADPPPGWERYTVTDEDGCPHTSLCVRRSGRRTITVQEAWRQFWAQGERPRAWHEPHEVRSLILASAPETLPGLPTMVRRALVQGAKRWHSVRPGSRWWPQSVQTLCATPGMADRMADTKGIGRATMAHLRSALEGIGLRFDMTYAQLGDWERHWHPLVVDQRARGIRLDDA